MPSKIDNTVAINLSVDIVNSYCRKDLSFLPVHMDARTFFIGPRKGQILRGAMEITNAWTPEHPMPVFTVSGLEASSIITGPTTCEVILSYDVTWHREDGTLLIHPQIMQVSWFMRQSPEKDIDDPELYPCYKVAVMHISNPEELDERDLVYNTFGDIAASAIGSSIQGGQQREQMILIQGTGAILNRYPAGSVIWIDSAQEGHHSVVHTRDRNIRCTKPLSYFMETYPGIFLQPSVSFLINPAFIKSIRRFQAELWNGKVLRIPEKKYMAFKKDFEAFAAGEQAQTQEP